MTRPSLFRLDSVRRTFGTGEVAVDAVVDVNLDIHRGEILAIIGPSGSGKTTLLNLLGGLDQPSEGTVTFFDDANSGGAAPRRWNLEAAAASDLTRFRRQRVGFVFQFYNLIPNLTALENVRTATELVEDPMPAMRALELVDLADRADHFPSQMSGGEQQRTAIARAVAKRPPLLLCDEPTGALDFETGKRVLRTLVDLRDELGTTIVLITHNGAIAPAADRVVRLRSGGIIECHANEHPVAPEEVVW